MRALLLALPALAAALSPPPRVLDKLNVHIVPHTHDDVGWLKTVDQYYVGAQSEIQDACVQCILDSVIDELEKDENRRFSYAEIAFFERWWREQTPARQASVKKLVASGQLEFINGGWCMHDEAAAHFVDMVDQTTLGHRFLNETFNIRPAVTWQIDPFGHSATQAALVAQAFTQKVTFMGRIDYADLSRRRKDHALEWRWQASASRGAAAESWGFVLGTGNYGGPDGFCWDPERMDPPIVTDKRLKEYNVDERVELFVQETLARADWFLAAGKGGDVLLPMGSDFQYSAAQWQFKNLDKLIAAVNADGRLNAFYSTPATYFAAKRAALEQLGPQVELKTDDLFPYGDGPHSLWTGYFTSRPSYKGLVSYASAYMQAARQLAVAVPSALDKGTLRPLAEALGVAQHHDSVSGTAKQAVSDDYTQRLSDGMDAAAGVINAALEAMTSGETSASASAFVQCPRLNVSDCPATEQLAPGKRLLVALYNPLARARTEAVRLPVSSADVAVLDADSNPVQAQVLPFEGAGDKFELVFFATIAPLTTTTFVLSRADAHMAARHTVMSSSDGGSTTLDNGKLKLEISESGTLSKMITSGGLSIDATQSFAWYESSVGNEEDDQAGGAYIMRPNHTQATPLEPTKASFHHGPLVQEARVEWGPWASLDVRLYANESHAEVAWSVGPIPFADGLGKEVALRLNTSVGSGEVFWTDANALELQKRVRDHRNTWTLDVTEPVAGNFYPALARAVLTDDEAEVAVVIDRAQAVASLASGEIEAVVHRRLLVDDSRGVGEALNETDCGCRDCDCAGLTVRGKQYVHLSAAGKGASATVALQQKMHRPFVAAFAPAPAADSSPALQRQGPQASAAAAAGAVLPENVLLMTLAPVDDGEGARERVLVRLAHVFESLAASPGYDPSLSKPAVAVLPALFPHAGVAEVQELTLTANAHVGSVESPFHVQLDPMQIRTFEVTLTQNAKQNKPVAGAPRRTGAVIPTQK
mmetsp:Transcript_26067/g.85678  ORF Transcript_26067/g.85678 Transcript_26067/m.85678 type:complete len:990 (+) Transcript_26067:4-2973(+)